MRLSQSSIPLSSRYLLTVLLFSTLTPVAKGQSKTVASNFSSVAVAKSNSSSSPIIRPLSIGDQVPDIVFENVLNYKSKKARLSDFKGKLVILDMWSVYCTSCIAAFPKMEALQKEFGDKIQILLVNPHDPKYDSEEKIKTTLEKIKREQDSPHHFLFQFTTPFLISISLTNLFLIKYGLMIKEKLWQLPVLQMLQ